ncbi:MULTISPECIES: hypothetical protein [Lactococcus]|uniref:hypothetical protein n=2 Tax=Streptococcaceae TaxID=1300 RepID=UPI000EC509AF|nr:MULTISPECIES: hypothetical protein [Lactococcus]HAP15058.1 hypothetical protein [Lactococcus sp.]
MTPEKKKRRQLRNFVLLSLLLLLVGGTFAFQAFNQRAINDRINENFFGGRVHDYFDRDTENKDVFVENFGEGGIMARVRLSEFMDIQRAGEASATPVVAGSTRDNVESWTNLRLNANNIAERVGDSAAFNQYSTLTFGWTRQGETAPWYMPTFNRDNTDLRTAAAGHARDWIAGAGATDGVTDGATHPGDGTDAYWSSGDSFNNSGPIWPGEEATHDAAQNLQQDRAPITMIQWATLPLEDRVGNFWVIDHQTGWAYWANVLQSGEATSYLLDAAEMTPAAKDISGQYYYGIHVDSQLVSPDHRSEFMSMDDEPLWHSPHLLDFLESVANGVDLGSIEDLPAHEVDFTTMRPGQIFTMEGEQYRYLENMGSGNHMIIRNQVFRNTLLTQEDVVFSSWFDGLDPAVQAMVQPVPNTFTTGAVSPNSLDWGDLDRWVPTNLVDYPEVEADVTQVDTSGTPRAFTLSLADVARLSGPGRGFSNPAGRVGPDDTWWLIRTRGSGANHVWRVYRNPLLFGRFIGGELNSSENAGGLRPALIVNPSN